MNVKLYEAMNALRVNVSMGHVFLKHFGHMISENSADTLINALRANSKRSADVVSVQWVCDPAPFLGHVMFRDAMVSAHGGMLVFTLEYPIHIKGYAKSTTAQDRWAQDRVEHLLSWGIKGVIVRITKGAVAPFAWSVGGVKGSADSLDEACRWSTHEAMNVISE